MSIFNNYKGKGVLNSIINKLPWEIHLFGYNFCGPGTHLRKRLQRGDQGINKLDQSCMEHDIAYAQNKSLEDRRKADWILENEAWNRVKSKDANIGEKTNAWLVTSAMKLKRKLGMGVKKFPNRKRKMKQNNKLNNKRKRKKQKQKKKKL